MVNTKVYKILHMHFKPPQSTHSEACSPLSEWQNVDFKNSTVFYFILLSSLFLRESILMNFTSKMPELARRLVLHYHHSVSPVSIYVVCVASVSHPSPLHLVLVVVLQVISSQIHIILFIFGCLIMIKGLVLCLCSGCFALISR